LINFRYLQTSNLYPSKQSS